MTTIPQRLRQTDRRTNCRSNTALCLASRGENTRQMQLFPACEKIIKSSQEYREFKTVVEADSRNMSETQKQNKKRNMIICGSCVVTKRETRKPCCRRESARCRCNFRSIDQDMINKDQWRTDFKLSYVTYLLNL